jgi:hypothetical protein
VDKEPAGPSTLTHEPREGSDMRRRDRRVVSFDLDDVHPPTGAEQPTAAVDAAVARVPLVSQDEDAGVLQRRQHNFLTHQRIDLAEVAEGPCGSRVASHCTQLA